MEGNPNEHQTSTGVLDCPSTYPAEVGDLNADSLDIVELVMAIEKDFDIEIPDDEAEKIQTVGAAIEYIVEAHIVLHS